MSPGPVLRTARLVLSPPAVADFADSLAMWSDPLVVRYMGGDPYTPQDAWSRLLRYAGLWSLLGFGYWTLRLADGGRFVGEVGFADFHRDMDPPLGEAPEAGWMLASWAHGQGYAGEATRAAFGWLDETRRPPRTVCMIDPANAPSLALAAKLGFRRFAQTRYKTREVVLLERAQPSP